MKRLPEWDGRQYPRMSRKCEIEQLACELIENKSTLVEQLTYIICIILGTFHWEKYTYGISSFYTFSLLHSYIFTRISSYDIYIFHKSSLWASSRTMLWIWVNVQFTLLSITKNHDIYEFIYLNVSQTIKWTIWFVNEEMGISKRHTDIHENEKRWNKKRSLGRVRYWKGISNAYNHMVVNLSPTHWTVFCSIRSCDSWHLHFFYLNVAFFG